MDVLSQSFDTFDAIVLVGGQGTRLAKAVPDVPKPMAQVAGRPFVDLVIARLRAQGVQRIVLATGHKAEVIHDFYRDAPDVICVREETPLGTGGAVLHVLAAVPNLSAPFFVLNGDSFYPFDLPAFVQSGDIGTVAMEDAGRYGTLEVDKGARITAFHEKTGKAVPGLVNAGVYLLGRDLLASLPQALCSLERDAFPALAAAGRLRAVVNPGPMIDIGLPETYRAAEEFFRLLDA